MSSQSQSSSRPTIGAPARELLVVSDELELLLFFKRELLPQRFKHSFTVDFRYSARNPNPEQMIALDVTRIDLRDEETIDIVISKYDRVLSLHCIQIFPRKLVENVCCINIHSGFNPYNRGMLSHTFSIINGLPAGATLHLMDGEIDHGDIIAQQQIQIAPSDTSLEVVEKVMNAEKELLRKYLNKIVEGDIESSPPLGAGNFNKLEDYKALCALDLAHTGTLKQHIDLLRAITWGSNKHGYFYSDGKKYLVGISIKEDATET